MAMRVFLDGLMERNHNGAVRSADLNTFTFEGERVPLVVQTGIWKPASLRAALTIRTTYTPPDQRPPYLDEVQSTGLVRYAYRGTDPDASDNRALRQAFVEQSPLAYFYGVERGVYRPIYPVWIVADDPAHLSVLVAVDEAQLALAAAAGGYSVADAPTPAERAYALRLTKQRLHQPVFRTQVLLAYRDTCAMCRLRHAELLDAAHIVADGRPQGEPVVPNGLSLCKIHHAAFDANILGIRPDLVIEVRRDVLEEIDGPMLRYGLQAMAGTELHVPRHVLSRPDAARLEMRYEEFRQAS